MEPLIARVVADRRRAQRRIRKLLPYVPSGLPRARAAVRRWSTFAFEVHAGTYVEVLSGFGVYWRAALRSVNSSGGNRRRAREPQANPRKSMRRIGRANGSRDPTGTALPDRSIMHAARNARGPWKRLLRKLTARTSLLRGLRCGGRGVLPRHGDGPVLGVVLGDLVDRVL